MSMMTRYMVKEFLRIFFVTATALAFVVFSIDFLEKIKNLYQYDTELQWLVKYFLFRFPRIFMEMLPLSLLMSTLLTFGGLAKNNEITAFKSAGVSVFRLTTPLLLLAAFISLFSYFLVGGVVPTLYKESKRIKYIQIEGKQPAGGFVENKIWMHLDSRRLMYAQVVSADKALMEGVVLYTLGDDYLVREEVEAAALIYEDGNWILVNGLKRIFLPGGAVEFKAFEREPIAIDRKPRDFQQLRIKTNEMTYKALSEYIVQLKAAGFDPTRYAVDLHAKQALPFVNFIMVLLGVPFALKDSRSSGIAWGIAFSLGVALFYWLVYSMTLSLGRLQVLPPWLAGWSANILLLMVGSYLFLRVRQ